MRILFFGSPDFAVPSLERLLEGPDEVVGIVSQPDRPQGRGLRAQAPPVVRRAREAGLSVLQPIRLHSQETLETLRGMRPELIVTCAFGRILRPALLDLPPCGCINVHASLLPRHRGAAPIAHTILAGDRWSGITIFRLDQGMDTGPILLQRLERVDPLATTGTLTKRLAGLGAVALADGLDRIRSGQARYHPQEEANATLAPRLSKEDGLCDWGCPADTIERFVRAMDPWPGARTVFRALPLRIGSVEPVDLLPTGVPAGTILGCTPDPEVAALPGRVRLCTVQAPGKKEMEGAAWARGARPADGERLG